MFQRFPFDVEVWFICLQSCIHHIDLNLLLLLRKKYCTCSAKVVSINVKRCWSGCSPRSLHIESKRERLPLIFACIFDKLSLVGLSGWLLLLSNLYPLNERERQRNESELVALSFISQAIFFSFTHFRKRSRLFSQQRANAAFE